METFINPKITDKVEALRGVATIPTQASLRLAEFPKSESILPPRTSTASNF